MLWYIFPYGGKFFWSLYGSHYLASSPRPFPASPSPLTSLVASNQTCHTSHPVCRSIQECHGPVPLCLLSPPSGTPFQALSAKPNSSFNGVVLVIPRKGTKKIDFLSILWRQIREKAKAESVSLLILKQSLLIPSVDSFPPLNSWLGCGSKKAGPNA